MTSTSTPFEPQLAPCGQRYEGQRHLAEDAQGLITEEQAYACGCRVTREEFHDGSVHRQIVTHNGKLLLDEELRGE
jgi:hypothetical protein